MTSVFDIVDYKDGPTGLLRRLQRYASIVSIGTNCGRTMNSADRHLDYDRQRRADLVRQARRSDLASAIGAERDAERRSFLARAWAKRFAPSRPLPDEVPEASPVIAQ